MTISFVAGDSLTVMRDMVSGSVGLILFSPPYNCRKGYDGFGDEMAWPDWYAWMNDIIRESYRLLERGGTLAINVPTVVRWQREHKFADSWSLYDPAYKNHVGSKQMRGKARIEPIGFRLFAMMEACDSHMREPVMWAKGDTEGTALSSGYQMGCDSDPYLRNAHEMVLLGSKEQWFHRGGTGRRGMDAMPNMDDAKDVWWIAPVFSVKHPAPFPVELARRLVRLYTHAPDALVLDPFCGIGSSAVACAELKRDYIGIDLSERYLNVARDRARAAEFEQLDMFAGDISGR